MPDTYRFLLKIEMNGKFIRIIPRIKKIIHDSVSRSRRKSADLILGHIGLDPGNCFVIDDVTVFNTLSQYSPSARAQKSRCIPLRGRSAGMMPEFAADGRCGRLIFTG